MLGKPIMVGTTMSLVVAPWQLQPESFTPEMPVGNELTSGLNASAMNKIDITTILRACILPIFISKSPIISCGQIVLLTLENGHLHSIRYKES